MSKIEHYLLIVNIKWNKSTTSSRGCHYFNWCHFKQTALCGCQWPVQCRQCFVLSFQLFTFFYSLLLSFQLLPSRSVPYPRSRKTPLKVTVFKNSLNHANNCASGSANVTVRHNTLNNRSHKSSPCQQQQPIIVDKPIDTNCTQTEANRLFHLARLRAMPTTSSHVRRRQCCEQCTNNY